MIDRATLTRLVAGADPAVSIYLPIDPERRDMRDPEARLRGLIEAAEQSLARRGMRPQQTAELLAPAHAVLDDPDLPRHRHHGRVFFLAPSLSQVFTLYESMPQDVTVGHNFLLRPLLPMLAHERRFHILALTAGGARLWDATPYSLSEHKAALPAGVDEVVAESEVQSYVQFNPIARPRSGPAVPVVKAHGTESPEDVRKAQLLEYLHRVAAAVSRELGEDPAPLVLVAEPEIAGHFRKLGKPAQLYEAGLLINPHGLADSDLLARVVELLRPVLEREIEGVLDQANARLGTAEPTVAIRLEEILPAAYDGRVDAVVVAADEMLRGRFDPEARTVRAGGASNGEGEDLLNEAAVVSLRNGGRAFALPRERIPRRAPAVATLRY